MPYSFPKDKINILLLENIDRQAKRIFKKSGYSAKILKTALLERDLYSIINKYHILGIRSKTEVREASLYKAKKLLAIGCYCIGTNQVDLDIATELGIPVFNAPFSNTRSVAEMVISIIIDLARKISWRNYQMHNKVWEKSAKGSFEVRGKTLGIIGYGHIGPQVGLMAESIGMNVIFYDIVKKLPFGNAKPCSSLKEVLQRSDFVSLHVPQTPLTNKMIGKKEISLMKKGSYLINASRGSVVELNHLKDALLEKHLSGVAIDVYPVEPKSNCKNFENILQGMENVILTPHIGGSSQEAQKNIAFEVSNALIKYLDTGSSEGAVNFPNLSPPSQRDNHRILNIHKNKPGVLSKINKMVAKKKCNILWQQLATNEKIGYLVMDVDTTLSKDIKKEIEKMPENIKTRLLF